MNSLILKSLKHLNGKQATIKSNDHNKSSLNFGLLFLINNLTYNYFQLVD